MGETHETDIIRRILPTLRGRPLVPGMFHRTRGPGANTCGNGQGVNGPSPSDARDDLISASAAGSKPESRPRR